MKPTKTKLTTTALLATGIAALALALAGCASILGSSKPVAQNIKITLDKTLENTSLQVDLIGANAVTDLPKWQSYSVTDYWQPGNTTRRDTDRVTLDFGPGKPAAQTFDIKDPKWKQWLATGAANLVIIADLPGVSTDKGGAADPRRLIIPLDGKSWKKSSADPIEILVQESGLRLLTPRK